MRGSCQSCKLGNVGKGEEEQPGGRVPETTAGHSSQYVDTSREGTNESSVTVYWCGKGEVVCGGKVSSQKKE